MLPDAVLTCALTCPPDHVLFSGNNDGGRVFAPPYPRFEDRPWKPPEGG